MQGCHGVCCVCLCAPRAHLDGEVRAGARSGQPALYVVVPQSSHASVCYLSVASDQPSLSDWRICLLGLIATERQQMASI